MVRGLAPSTLESYGWVIRRFLPKELLQTRLEGLQPQQLNALYAHLLTDGRRRGREKGRGLSPRTIRGVHAVLHHALHDAVRLRMIEWNPAQAADPPSWRARSPVFAVWSNLELKEFLLASANDRDYAAYHLAAFTGLRRGELLGLRWSDLDLERAVLRVLQTVVLLGTSELQIGPPKTNGSRRVVALDHQTVTVLTRHRRRAERLRGSPLDVDGLVFSDRFGNPINPGTFSHRFRDNVKSAGIRQIRFHDLRHTHATHALQAGIHPKVVSERLGHSSVGITLEIYSHVLPNMQAEAAEAVAALCALPIG
jgi:integrase